MRETEFLIAPREPNESIRAQAEFEVDDRKTRRQSADRFLDLVQGLDVIVWEMDAVTEQFTFVSDRAQDILGYPISQWFEEPQFWQDRLLHPEDRDRGINLSVTATNQAGDHDDHYRAIAADGRVVWLKNLVRLACDSKGRPKFLRGVMIDITNEKEAEERKQQQICEQVARVEVETIQEALRKSEERYRSLTEATTQIIWNTNPEGELVTEQPRWSAFTGQTYEEYKRWGWLNAIHPDDQYNSAQAWRKALANRSLYEVEYRLRRYDGEYRYTSARGVPVLEPDSSIREWVGVNTDITEQVRARQEIEKKAEELTHLMQSLERSNQELDQFAYVASHDLKAPLRAIANLAEWIEEDLADQLPDESREHMNLLRGRVHRMVALIDGILQHSRAGRKQQVEIVNVSALVSEVIELLTPPPEVLIVVEPGMPIFKGEKIPLEQVFMNLIGNAIKYANSPDARVWVSVRDIGKYYEFAIADNGSGIAPLYHEKIWSIFQRLEARDKVEGTGIGLSVVKKIVESRGGRVSVESEIGAGATFRFTWPKYSQKRFKS